MRPGFGLSAVSLPHAQSKNRGGQPDKTGPAHARHWRYVSEVLHFASGPPASSTSHPPAAIGCAWQPDVSCALGTQQPGSGGVTQLVCQCRFLAFLGRASSIGLVSSPFYIKIAHCLVPASFRLPSSLPDQLAMRSPQRAPSALRGPNPRRRGRSSDVRQSGPPAIGWRGGGVQKSATEARGCASDAISMHPTRNGLARPRCNGAIPSSESGMCSSAVLYLLHPRAVSGAPEPISTTPGPPPMASRDAPALLELYCPCQPASLHALRGVHSATSPPCPQARGRTRRPVRSQKGPGAGSTARQGLSSKQQCKSFILR